MSSLKGFQWLEICEVYGRSLLGARVAEIETRAQGFDSGPNPGGPCHRRSSQGPPDKVREERDHQGVVLGNETVPRRVLRFYPLQFWPGNLHRDMQVINPDSENVSKNKWWGRPDSNRGSRGPKPRIVPSLTTVPASSVEDEAVFKLID